MNTPVRLVAFLAAWSGGSPVLFRERFVEVRTARGTMRVRCTEPRFPARAEPPLVVFVHGMSLRGERDPRQDSFCEALACAGFRVLAPRIEEVASLRFGRDSVDQIAEFLEAVSGDAGLSRGGRFSVASVSFSAAATMIACARETLRDRVDVAFVLGGYCDVRLCVAQLLTTAKDDYGRLLGLKNFLRFAGESTPAIDDALLRMCEDNVAGRPEATRIERARALPPEERDRLVELLVDVDARHALLDRAFVRTPELWDLLDLAPALPFVRFPVTIVHGAGDDVIDVEQAHMLAAELRARRVEHRLCVTPLVDHGTKKGLFDAGLAIVDLLRGVAFFFDHASRGAPRATA